MTAAKTVDQYLSALPDDRRRVVSSLRTLILTHLPAGYQESYNWGMIAYEIPLERYPHTYNGQPLAYVALASQKHHFGLYLLAIGLLPAQVERLEAGFADAGKRLDMGKACVRFKSLDEVSLSALGEAIASMPPDLYIERYEASRTTATNRATKATKTRQATKGTKANAGTSAVTATKRKTAKATKGTKPAARTVVTKGKRGVARKAVNTVAKKTAKKRV